MNERNPGEQLSNGEVYKLADSLMRRHGKDAVIVASMRAGEMLDMGDMEGYRTWKRLIMLVDGMAADGAPPNMNLH
ncbi:MAG: hypothetical protein HQ504_12115 [Rhodospirillaceae bacterium]|nr:hypothetical protein [Rhodospirillaceae bacterium]